MRRKVLLMKIILLIKDSTEDNFAISDGERLYVNMQYAVSQIFDNYSDDTGDALLLVDRSRELLTQF